jgi:hypothetical protein
MQERKWEIRERRWMKEKDEYGWQMCPTRQAGPFNSSIVVGWVEVLSYEMESSLDSLATILFILFHRILKFSLKLIILIIPDFYISYKVVNLVFNSLWHWILNRKLHVWWIFMWTLDFRLIIFLNDHYICKLKLDLRKIIIRILVCFSSSWWWLSLTKSSWLTPFMFFFCFFFRFKRVASF